MTSLTERFYEPVKTGLAVSYDDRPRYQEDFDPTIYGVRQRGLHGSCVLGAELKLSWEKADLLCDLLETVRRTAKPQSQAA